jgi:hypothetical protein
LEAIVEGKHYGPFWEWTVERQRGNNLAERCDSSIVA